MGVFDGRTILTTGAGSGIGRVSSPIAPPTGSDTLQDWLASLLAIGPGWI